MTKASTPAISVKRLKIGRRTRRAYGKRDRALGRDPDAPQVPPDYLGQLGDRLVLSTAQDSDFVSRIDEILRERMTRDR